MAGLFLMAFSNSGSFNAFAAGYALIGGAGVVKFSIYPERQQAIIHAAMNCLFDASAAVFLIFEQLYFHASISRKAFFIIMVVLCMLCFGAITILWQRVEPLFFGHQG